MAARLAAVRPRAARCRRYCSSKASSSAAGGTGRVRIGDVSCALRRPRNAELVPRAYVDGATARSQSTLRHLRWLMQKDQLGQDVFLLGPPGKFRRQLVMQYLELTNREYEYVAVTRDTTEADIKQRREILHGNAYYVDLCAVRAALHGRVLIVDGVEKAERNVLPILNNLLENREMQLDDGRFILSGDKLDKLPTSSRGGGKLLAASSDFRVIALGLPVPKFRGHSLDPPFRSRFQCRNVDGDGFKETHALVSQLAPNVDADKLNRLLSFAYGSGTDQLAESGLSPFPVDSLPLAAKYWSLNPRMDVHDVVEAFYPYALMAKDDAVDVVRDTLHGFEIATDGGRASAKVAGVSRRQAESVGVELRWAGRRVNIEAAGGTAEPSLPADSSSGYVATSSHDAALCRMALVHAAPSDMCIVAPKGTGKNVLVDAFARLFGYGEQETERVVCYQDMSSRELLQQRRMLPNGDTSWAMAPLARAALAGRLVVLQSVHHLHHTTLNAVQRLIQDGEMELFDGARLLSAERYAAVQLATGLTDELLAERRIRRISPRFRIVLAGDKVNAAAADAGGAQQQWLTAELATLCPFVELAPASVDEERAVVRTMAGLRRGGGADRSVDSLLRFAHYLRDSKDASLAALSSCLSTRQIIRILRRINAYGTGDGGDCLYDMVHKVSLSRFLPSLTRQSIEAALKECGIVPLESAANRDVKYAIDKERGELRIGSVSAPVHADCSEHSAMVPDILFYDNEQHVRILESMLKDWLLGEHLLLIGNQGVGKNKVADRFLQLLNRPRQYIQLHRDTTVHTLTLQANMVDGVLTYQDSPLVLAARLGHVLVIDEGDKAPTHVTAALGGLLQGHTMHLADGRKILPPGTRPPPVGSGGAGAAEHIVAHGDFRVIVLANRPGFPFLGNDFFASMGDLFACHAVDNPSAESELGMMRQYGPDVPQPLLAKLVAAFAELRGMADEGLLTYPYSSRELVHIVRHMQRYGGDGLPQVLSNVFDFDAHAGDTVDSVAGVMRRHGIVMRPFAGTKPQARLAQTFELAAAKHVGTWQVGHNEQPISLQCATTPLNIVGVGQPHMSQYRAETLDGRSEVFSEQVAMWQLPLEQSNLVSDVCAIGTHLYTATVNPLSVYATRLDAGDARCTGVDYSHLVPVPRSRAQFRPRAKLAVVGAHPTDSTSPSPAHSAQWVVLHEEMTNQYYLFDPANPSDAFTIGNLGESSGFLTRAISAFTPAPIASGAAGHWRMQSELAERHGVLVSWLRLGDTVCVADFANGRFSEIKFGHNVAVRSVTPIAADCLAVKLRNDANLYTLHLDKLADETAYLRRVDVHLNEDIGLEGALCAACADSVSAPVQSAIVGGDGGSGNESRLLATGHARWPNLLTVGTEALLGANELYGIEKPVEPLINVSAPYWMSQSATDLVHPGTQLAFLADYGQILRVVPSWQAPSKIVDKHVNMNRVSGFVHVSDMARRLEYYLPVPKSKFAGGLYSSWQATLCPGGFVLAASAHSAGCVTADVAGAIRLWETDLSRLANAQAAWKRMLGIGDEAAGAAEGDGELRLDVQSDDFDLSKLDMPKHGQFDPTGAPHHGGGTWAGGTGGYNTAGMGGVGGPYRLDLGHTVYQMPQEAKDSVPEEVKRKAREIAKRAWEQRLREIEMSPYDADAYAQFYSAVAPLVERMARVIDGLRARGKERLWMRHQTSGDVDESKLIEGVTGQRTVYRRRADREPEPGSPMVKPKLLRVAADVSASMYRFNGYDNRLQKTLQTCLMIMESMANCDDRIQYELVGHSGETDCCDFVKRHAAPRDQKRRLDVLKSMLAHAQFCINGDSTLDCAALSIREMAKVHDVDERILVVLSDANLSRYGIRPQELARIMQSDSTVNAFVIFLGSLGEQADVLKRSLPAGKSFICRDTADLPVIMQSVFSSTLFVQSD